MQEGIRYVTFFGFLDNVISFVQLVVLQHEVLRNSRMELTHSLFLWTLDDHTVALTASDTAARLSREETMKEERTRASAEISDATKHLQKQHHDVVAALRNEHNSAVYCWENEREMMSHEIKILKESIKEAAGGLEEMKAGSAGREKLLMDMVETIRRENLVNMEDEKSRVERTLSLAAERASSSEADMKAAFKEECLKYESHLEISRSSLEALDIRWRNRESRPEDVRRIRLLESECASKDDLVAKTREEMIYFKREMLNREENFNQKFGRSPVVGVMQVVRPKDSGFGGLSTSDSGTKPLKPSASTGGFGGVRSSKPTYSVGVGGNNTGMETGLGSSGLGNGSAPGSLSSSLSNAEVSLKVRNDPGRRSFS